MLSVALAVSVIALLTLVAISLSKSAGRSPNGFELRPRCAEPNSVFVFREVCRSVLNTSSLGSSQRMRLQLLWTFIRKRINSGSLVCHYEL